MTFNIATRATIKGIAESGGRVRYEQMYRSELEDSSPITLPAAQPRT